MNRKHDPHSPDLRPPEARVQILEDLLAQTRRQLEQVTHDANRFRQYVEGIHEGIWEMDGNFITTYVNPHMALMLGYAVDEMVGKPVSAFMHPDDLLDHDAKMTNRQAGNAQTYERRFRHRDGSTRTMLVSAIPLCGHNGDFSGSFATFTDITTLKEAEQARRAAERDRITILASISELVAFYDLDFRIRWANRAAAESAGLHVDEMVGQRCYQLWHQRDKPCENCPVVHTLDTGQAGNIETVTPDGRVFHLRSYPVFDEEHAMIGAVEVGLDITAEAKARDALRTQDERLKLALDAVSDGVWDWNLINRTCQRSDHWYQLTGFTRGELEEWERQHGSIVHTDDWWGMEEAFQAHFRGDAPIYQAEFRIRHKSGQWRSILGRGRIVEYASDGKPARMVGTDSDITALRQTEAALHEGQARYRTIYEHAALGMFESTPEGKVLNINPAYARIFGFDSPADALEYVTDITQKVYVYPERRKDIVAKVLAAPGVHAFEVPYRRKDGTIFIGALKIEAIRDVEGHPVHLYGFVEDITERKAAEEKLREYRDHLEELVEQRTQQLRESEARLRQNERLASLGTLAAGIAHEVNNPLGMILLDAEEALRHTADTDTVRQALHQIKHDVQRCSRVVKGILQFARDQQTEKWPSDLNSIIRHALDFTREYARSCNVTIRPEFARTLPPIVGNTTELEQVFVNLIHNAIHACPPHGTATIQTWTENQHVRAAVHDSGPGMTTEQIQHAFDPFYTTRLSEGGTGLGLSICHGIVTEHHGVIWIESSPTDGTTVHVQLPRAPRGDTPHE